MRPQNLHRSFIGLRACPVLLEFEEVLQRGDGDRTRLNESIDGPLMSLSRKVAAGVGRDINFEVLLEHVECRERHAGFRPKSAEDELLAPGRMDGLAKVSVQP